jgi:hypothetical protein
MVGQWIVDDRDCQHAVIATLSRGITIFEREIETTSQTDGSQEKKKRRDTGFPPTKQLFQLPNRANKGGSGGNQSTDTDKAASAANKNGMGMHRKEEIAVKMAAEYCMSQFVNQLGNFPPWKDQIGPTRTSTLLDDLSLIKALKDIKAPGIESVQLHDTDQYLGKRIQLFLLDGRVIVGLMDISDLSLPSPDNAETHKAPAVVLICRDTTGRYSWTSHLRYEDLTSKLAPSTPRSTSSASSSPKYTVPLVRAGSSPTFNNLPHMNKPNTSIPIAEAVNCMELPSLDKLLLAKPEKKAELEKLKIITATQQLAEQESQRDETHNIPKSSPESPVDSTVKQYVNYIIPICCNNFANQPFHRPPSQRLFLAQLGYLHNKNRTSVIPLRITDSLISELETLDLLNEYVDS